MNQFDHRKYRPVPVVPLDHRQWPGRVIEQAPRWASVDLRDGNQALLEPMTVEQKRRLWSGIAMLGYRKERFLLSDETVAAADAALAASRDTDSLIEQADAQFGAGFARIFSDQSEEAIEYFLDGLALANKAGALQSGGLAATYLCVAYRQCGDLEKLRLVGFRLTAC